MYCFTLFGNANPVQLGPQNQHILQKILYQIKEVVYTLKAWPFIFRYVAFFLVPKIMIPNESFIRSGKLPAYPSPKPTFCPKLEVSVNDGLGEG